MLYGPAGILFAGSTTVVVVDVPANLRLPGDYEVNPRSFAIKTGDELPKLRFKLTAPDGTDINLTGATVHLVLSNGIGIIHNAPATIRNAPQGIVEPNLPNTQDLEAGDYLGEIKVTFPSGDDLTFPTEGYINISVRKSLWA